MPVFNEYYYNPLCAEDGLRLVVLDPSTDRHALLTCSIIERRRSTATTTYCTVSYVWGEPSQTPGCLEINEGGNPSYLRITPSLDALLRQFRRPDRPHILWVDAICLNQDDEIEKAQIIPYMGRIYERAEKVHIWLGAEDKTTGTLFTFIRQAAKIRPGQNITVTKKFVKLMKNVFGHGAAFPRGMEEVVNFSERPWFSRRWIIQEACLSSEAIVHCGSYSIPLPLLVSFARRFQALEFSSYPIKTMATLQKPQEKTSILELLRNFHEAECREPKDRIAALFGLVSDDYRFNLEYIAHWTETCKDVAAFMLGMGSNDISLQLILHLFEFGGVPGQDNSYPSWVPDWSQTRQRALPFHSEIENPDSLEQYPASPGHCYEHRPTTPGSYERANLTINCGVLNIHWRSSIAGPKGRQVAWAAQLGLPQQDEARTGVMIADIIQQLFPRRQLPITRILPLCALLMEIIKFRQPPAFRIPLDDPALNSFLKTISQGLPHQYSISLLEPLRQLHSLRGFCLFELAPFGSGCALGGDYGIGPFETEVGDLMIPLWRPESQPTAGEFTKILRDHGRTIHLSTMLVVRPTGGHPRQPESVGNDQVLVQSARIVGPAVCIISEATGSLEKGASIDGPGISAGPRETMYSMRLS